jgi:hypothetical protein
MELPAPDGLPRWYPRSPAAAGSGGLRAAAVWNVATAARLRRTQPAPGLPDVLAWPARRRGHGGQLCALYPPCDHGGQGRADRWTSKAAAQQGCSHTDRPWTFTAHPYWGCGRPQPCLNDHRSAFVLVRACLEPPAGIEPATPSLPCIPGPPPCDPAFSQVVAHRKWRSYGVVAVGPVGPSSRSVPAGIASHRHHNRPAGVPDCPPQPKHSGEVEGVAATGCRGQAEGPLVACPVEGRLSLGSGTDR